MAISKTEKIYYEREDSPLTVIKEYPHKNTEISGYYFYAYRANFKDYHKYALCITEKNCMKA